MVRKIEVIPNNETPIQQFFLDQTLLITGATGFVGKVLVEKLLRSCNVKKIYLLVRKKKQRTSEIRFKDIFDNELFDVLKSQNPDALKKVILINGDMELEQNGINEADRKLLIKEVTCIFHSAATVNFSDPLKKAINLNIRSVRDLLDLAKEMKNLKAFVHVSTAYCNCIYKEIEEKFYPEPIDCDRLLNIINLLDEKQVDLITPTVLGDWPNTYVFTKRIAEDLIKKNAKNIPMAIFRPGIVIPTCKEPVVGWSNSIIGFVGMFTGNCLGVLRVLNIDTKVRTELVSADFVVNCMLAVAWETANKVKNNNEDIKIYNYVASTFEDFSITWESFLNNCQDLYYKYAPMNTIWYPILICVKSRTLYVILHYLLHVVPGYFTDKLLVLLNRKPILIKTYEKVHKAQQALAYFGQNEWNFKCENVLKLWNKLDEKDKDLFEFNLSNYDVKKVIDEVVFGGRKYILKESPSNLPAARRKYIVLAVAHYLLCAFLLSVFVFVSWKMYVFLFS